MSEPVTSFNPFRFNDQIDEAATAWGPVRAQLTYPSQTNFDRNWIWWNGIRKDDHAG